MPKTQQEKDEIRRQAEAHRQPDKDRSVHDAAQGKKMTLEALSLEAPSTLELGTYVNFIIAENDRGSAVMSTSLVEKALEDVVRAYMVDPGDGTPDTWFVGRNAPFRSFSAKIALGRALGIYGPGMEKRLNTIRRIRNVFAHRMLPIDFTHPTIKAECKKLTPHPEKDAQAKVVFGAACMALAKILGIHAETVGGKEKKLPFP